MHLYISETSPYARILRIVLREKRLQDRVTEVAALTRTKDSQYYAVNPSGRIPFQTGPDGLTLEGSALIADFLDDIDGHPLFARPTDSARWQNAVFRRKWRAV